MEMNLQPLAKTCCVSGEPFVEGARVASYLVRAANMEIIRHDVLEGHAADFQPDGFVACRWVQPYKPRRAGENQDRALKLTAESLFATLADPTTEPTPENTRLLQFLALMLERKKVLRPRGRTADGARNRYEHAKTKQIFEVPVGEMTPEFFIAVQEQLSILVGAPKPKDQPANRDAGAAADSGGEPAAPATVVPAGDARAAAADPAGEDSPAPSAGSPESGAGT